MKREPARCPIMAAVYFGISIASVGLRGEPTGAPTGFGGDVVMPESEIVCFRREMESLFAAERGLPWRNHATFV